MSELRIGLIGAGGVGGLHANAIETIGESVSAVADIDRSTREEFAAEYDVEETYESYERMIDESNLDLVVVGVPNALHEECAVAALEAGLTVVVEKPLAHTLESAERIQAAEQASDGQVIMGFVRSYEPWVEEVRSRIDAGDFGTVYDVDAELIFRRSIPNLGGWFTRDEVSGGGVLIDLGVHLIHLVLTTLDFPEIESVSASTGGYFGSKEDYTYLSMWGGGPASDDPVFDVDDNARAFIRTADGTTIHVRLSWAINAEHRHSIRIAGDEMGATIEPGDDGLETTLYSTERGRLTDTTLQLPGTNRFTLQWEGIREALEAGTVPRYNSVDEGVTVQRIVDAIYRSSETGSEITF